MKPTAEQLATILADHALWLGDPALGAQANLRSANLRYADLRSANLRSADLRSANLDYADLRSANLDYADLRSADLRSANLRYADLRSADLRSADLRSADLRSANLRSAKINWNSHWLVTEILRRDAGEHLGKLAVAGVARLRDDLCWNELLALKMPYTRWALGVLADWVQDDDNAPDVLRDLAAKRKAKAAKH